MIDNAGTASAGPEHSLAVSGNTLLIGVLVIPSVTGPRQSQATGRMSSGMPSNSRRKGSR